MGPALEKRLAAYAAAVGAAGLGVLASASAADAKVIYFPASQHILPNTTFALDVNHDGVTDFNITDTFGCNFDYCYGRLSAVPVAGNAVEGKLGFLGTRLASALNAGAEIGPAAPFSGQLMMRTSMGSTGQWLNVTNRFLGLKFQFHGQTHYGWARLTVRVKSTRVTAALTGYAYETVPNVPIAAGQVAGAEGATVGASRFTRAIESPEPLFLAVLALGAQGYPLWRRNNRDQTDR